MLRYHTNILLLASNALRILSYDNDLDRRDIQTLHTSLAPLGLTEIRRVYEDPRPICHGLPQYVQLLSSILLCDSQISLLSMIGIWGLQGATDVFLTCHVRGTFPYYEAACDALQVADIYKSLPSLRLAMRGHDEIPHFNQIDIEPKPGWRSRLRFWWRDAICKC